ncbi:MAG: 50S ribosomal protein L13 [Candidatus Pacebacteria bacterium]|nr:50S ribosomal protein L13 [Candidatus Paceibacterota bacterium]
MEKQNKNNKNRVTIDAQGQSLGRLASKIAVLLQDKHKTEYAPNKAGETIVVVQNFGKIKPFPKTKSKNKIYYKHTGYIGHLKETSLEKMWEKDPKQVLKIAVQGMLPKNKLRPKRMKRLIINF